MPGLTGLEGVPVSTCFSNVSYLFSVRLVTGDTQCYCVVAPLTGAKGLVVCIKIN